MQPQNPGSFDSASAGGMNGQGSALMRLMALRQQGASPQAGNNVPLPAAPVQTGSPINMQSMNQAAQQPPMQAAQPQLPQGAPQQTFGGEDPNLSLALGALSNYIKAHAEGHMADKGVHMAKANAKVREASAPQNPPAAPVGGQ